MAMIKLTITDMDDNILEEEAFRSFTITPARELARRIIASLNASFEIVEAPEDEDDDS